MGNILFSLTIAILSLQFFTVTYRLNGINRTLFNIPLGIFEASIPLVEESDKIVMHYDKDELYERLTYYFDENLHKYVSKYRLKLYYYNQSNMSFCTKAYCDAVEITLSADVLLTVKYEKKAKFYIRSNV